MPTLAVTINPAFQALLDQHGVVQSRTGARRFRDGDVLHITEHSIIGKRVGLYRGAWVPHLGHYSYTHSEFAEPIVIGNYCSIAENVQVFGYDHPTDGLSTSPFTYSPDLPLFGLGPQALGGFSRRPPHAARPPPVLGHDVWVGRAAILRTGITIGHGAVIGAGAVVTRDVPPYAVVAGNPARVLRYRFDDTTIEALLATRWWTHDFGLLGRIDHAQGIAQQLTTLQGLLAQGEAAPLPPPTNLYEWVAGMIQRQTPASAP